MASGLDVPWGSAFLPHRDMLVTERRGRVRLVRDGKLLPAAIATVPVTDSGEGGLLGIATHPNVASNRLYYTTDTNGRAANRVERWRLSSV